MSGSPSKLSTSTTSTRPITRSMSGRDDDGGENRPRTLSIRSEDFELPEIGMLSYINGILIL